MRGRKPKPVERRIAEGNPGHRPLPEPVALGSELELEPPEGLPEEAQAFWREAVPILNEVGLLSAVDRPALEMAAIAYARFRQAGAVLEREGILARGAAGQTVEHPAAASERNAAALFVRFAEQYALTPVARTRLGLAELQRRSMQTEIAESLGEPQLEPA